MPNMRKFCNFPKINSKKTKNLIKSEATKMRENDGELGIIKFLLIDKSLSFIPILYIVFVEFIVQFVGKCA